MRNRHFIAGLLTLAVIAVSAVVTSFSGTLTPNQKYELVTQMQTVSVVAPEFSMNHPERQAVPFCAPPEVSVGVAGKVEAHCNSPGNIEAFLIIV